MRAICFSPEKMKPLKSRCEALSPIKVCNYSIKRNHYSQEDEMHINKRTRLSDPEASQVDFNIVEKKVEEDLTTLATVSDVLAKKSVSRVSFRGNPETIKSNGKMLMKQEGIFTDETGSIRIVFWQSDIQRIESGSSYELSKAIVKKYESANYITINRQSVVRPSNVKITRDDDEKTQKKNINKVFCPAIGVERVTSYLSCNKCNASLLQNDNRKVVQCSNCGCGQLKSKCKNCIIVKTLFIKDEEQLSLSIFDDKLAELYKIYQKQANSTKCYSELNEDDIMEFMLMVEAVVCYNNRLNVTSIECKCD